MILPAISRRHVVRYKGQTRDLITPLLEKKSECAFRISELEDRFARYIGVRHALAASSGRVSLEVMLRALNFGAGGEVILPAYTYHSVPDAIRAAGLVPVFVDICPADNNLDVGEVARKIGPRTAAVLATHIFGHPCRIDALSDLCRDRNIVLLEDCAHSLGAAFKGKRVGAFGRAGFFSFGATKVFNTYGGGMIVTDDEGLAQRMRAILETHAPSDRFGLAKTILAFSALHFFTRRWPFTLTLYPALRLMQAMNLDVIGLYSRTFKRTAESISAPIRYSELQAALALRQMETIDSLNQARWRNAEALLEMLHPDIPRLAPLEGAESVWYFFAIGARNRDTVARRLLEMGVDTGRHIMENCAALAGGAESFPITEWWREHSIQIPIHPPLGERDMAGIAKAVNEAFAALEK